MPDGGLISGPLLFSSLGAVFSTTVIGSVTVGSLFVTAALSGSSYLLQKNAAKKAQRGLTNEIDKQIVKQALPFARIILGEALVGGSLFFAERRGDWIYYGIALMDGQVDGITEIRMSEKVVSFDGAGGATSLPFFDGSTTYLYKSFRDGTEDQSIDPLLAADFPELPPTFRQRGVATIVLKIWLPKTISNELRTTLYGTQGQPTPIMKVRGVKVFDPRDPSQSHIDKSTWKWKRSPSLCAAYMQTLPRNYGGAGSSWDEIDLVALVHAANDDDNPVPRKDGTTEPCWTCDGVVTLDGTAPSEIIQKILTANMGYRVTSNGKYVFLSGVPRSPVWTLNDDSARGSMSIALQAPLDSRVNIVKSQFVSSEREYQAQEGPELRNAAYIAEDGMEMPLSVELLFTNSHTMAQRICSITMKESRIGNRISRRENLNAILLDAADIVNVEAGVFPACNGQYILESISAADTPIEFDVSLRGYNQSVYDWTPSVDEQDFIIAPAQISE